MLFCTIVRLSSLGLLCLVCADGRAEVINGNFSSSPLNGAGTFMGLSSTTIYKTVGWTMPGEAYTLEHASLSMDFSGGGEPIVAIWTGHPTPTAQLAVLQSPPLGGIGDFLFTPTEPLVMEAGETYWLYVVSVPNPSGSFWWQGSSPTTVPTGVATHVGYIFNGNPSSARNRFEIVGELADICYANCDASTAKPILTVDDFTCFINEFAAATALPHEQQITHYANCDGSTTAPVLTVDDFTCFINAFAQGCP